MEDEEKKKIVLLTLFVSLQDLYQMDYVNIEMNVSERNICARLAHHFENRMRSVSINVRNVFAGYFADVEYNRMTLGEKKDLGPKIIFTTIHEEIKATKIVCDLLIHSRDLELPNLLAVEMKKEGNFQAVDEDKERLCEMVSTKPNSLVYNTLIGAFITYSEDKLKIEFFEKDQNGHGKKTREIECQIESKKDVYGNKVQRVLVGNREWQEVILKSDCHISLVE